MKPLANELWVSSQKFGLSQGNLLKGIIICFVRGEGIEPIKRASSSHTLYNITKWFKIAVFIYRTRAIITRGLYIFYPIFQCGL